MIAGLVLGLLVVKSVIVWMLCRPIGISTANATRASFFYGDASQVEVLKTAGAEQAEVLVCTLDQAAPALRLVKILRQRRCEVHGNLIRIRSILTIFGRWNADGKVFPSESRLTPGPSRRRSHD